MTCLINYRMVVTPHRGGPKYCYVGACAPMRLEKLLHNTLKTFIFLFDFLTWPLRAPPKRKSWVRRWLCKPRPMCGRLPALVGCATLPIYPSSRGPRTLLPYTWNTILIWANKHKCVEHGRSWTRGHKCETWNIAWTYEYEHVDHKTRYKHVCIRMYMLWRVRESSSMIHDLL